MGEILNLGRREEPGDGNWDWYFIKFYGPGIMGLVVLFY